MHKLVLPLVSLAVLGLVGSAAAQENSGSGAGNPDASGTMTCADLNEMEEAEATSFLRGYNYAMTAGERANAGTTTANSTTTTNSASAPTAAATTSASTATGVGTAVTTGDVTRTEGTAGSGEGTPFDAGAILTSCHDVPSTSIDEVLSGAYGAVK